MQSSTGKLDGLLTKPLQAAKKAMDIRQFAYTQSMKDHEFIKECKSA